MLKYFCKSCNKTTSLPDCPFCGQRTQIESSIIYWCEDCNIPIYDEVCPLCQKKGKRIGSDIRPVFPAERLLSTKSVILSEEIEDGLREVGLSAGDQVIVHTSLRSLGYVCSGAQVVIEALLKIVGEDGTVMMPTQGWKTLTP